MDGKKNATIKEALKGLILTTVIENKDLYNVTPD